MNKPKVYLDGVLAEPETINPAVHRFLGMFRPAVNPLDEMVSKWGDDPNRRSPMVFMCVCGERLDYSEQNAAHYRRGCCDVPQYQTITP